MIALPDSASRVARFDAQDPDPSRAVWLEDIGRHFLRGYNTMLLSDPIPRLEETLDDTETALHGFVVEGAAMGAAIRDALSLRDGLLSALLARMGGRFGYLIHVGAGWAIARTPWRVERIRRSLSPVLFSLALDGRGFHDLYFHPERAAGGRLRHGRGNEARAYDQGLGRGVWFISLAHVPRALDLVAGFAPARRGDILAGLGLAMAYAGPARGPEWDALLGAHPRALPDVGQGICFAAEARVQAGDVTGNLETACEHMLGMSVEIAAAHARHSRPEPGATDRVSAAAAYEAWRGEIRGRIARHTGQTHRNVAR